MAPTHPTSPFSDLHASESELLRSQRRLRRMIELASEMLVVFDEHGRFKWESASNVQILGYAPDDLVGHSVFNLVHRDDRDRLVESVRRCLAIPDQPSPVEGRYKHRDGSWRVIQAIGRNLMDDEDIRGIVVTGWDVTDRRSLEAQLRQSQKMDALGRLAGGIAHDFNNALTIFMGSAELMLAELPSDAAQRNEAELIRSTAEHAAMLTKQLLTFSRSGIVQPRRLDLNAVLEGVHKMLGRLIGADIELRVVKAEGLPPVFADESQVAHALINLVVNARDAMPLGGTLTLRTGTVPEEVASALCGRQQGGTHAMIAVSDTGEGIPLELQSKIFDPFFTTKAPGKGTGLGLSTVYGAMQQAGGCVSLSSEPGRGAEFQLIFPPATRPPLPIRAPTPFPDRRTAPARVLLVEDNAAVRFLAARVLERAGFTVQQAAEGTDALALMADDRAVPDLVITDVVMPGIGIAEFIAQLRGSRPGVRLLLMSGYTDEEVVRRGVEQQDYPFIHKPFKSADLVRAVREALDG